MVLQKFTLIEEDFEHKRKNYWERFFLCKCECWVIKSVRMAGLKTWETKSCWCHRIANWKKNKTHWMFWTSFYGIWSWMKDRCYNKKTKAYKNYWWRWIFMCDKRLKFEWFHGDMYWSYKKDVSIDRIDNDKWYSKENCRRATTKEQNRNTRQNIIYKWKCISEWAEIRWVNACTIYKRYSVWWWSLYDSIFTPVRKR